MIRYRQILNIQAGIFTRLIKSLFLVVFTRTKVYSLVSGKMNFRLYFFMGTPFFARFDMFFQTYCYI